MRKFTVSKLYTLFCIILASCVSKNGKDEQDDVLKTIESLESHLQIQDTLRRGTAVARIQQIERAIKKQDFLEKFPVLFYSPDSVPVDSTFTAAWTMASYMPTSLPTAIIKSNDGVDTVDFDTSCGCFPILLKDIEQGRNKYQGRILDNDKIFAIEGWFHGYYKNLP